LTAPGRDARARARFVTFARETVMPNGLKAVVAFNLIAVALIGYFAYAIGGGFEPAVFPPDRGHELRLVPLHTPAAAPRERAAATPQRIEVPTAFLTVDPGIRPWEYLPDGSVRFADPR
jgi:hypothetical protein